MPQIAVAQTAAEATIDAPIVQTDDDIKRAYRAVKRDEAYQYELAEPIPRRPASAFEKAIGRFFNAIFSFIAPLLVIIFWVGLGALGLAALYLIGRAIYETRFAKPEEKSEGDPCLLYTSPSPRD